MIDRLHHVGLQLFRRLPVRARRQVVRSITPSFTVGAMCFIEREDGALLLVRLSYRDRWGVPGGLLKRGETPDDAARREVQEEVGLRIDLVGEPAVVVAADPRRVDVIFRAKLAPGQLSHTASAESAEIVEVGWFPRDDLPELQHETSGALVALARSARAPQAVPLPSARDRDDGQRPAPHRRAPEG